MDRHELEGHPLRFERIVVATDFSPASMAALERARGLVAPRGELVLVHVIEALAPSTDPQRRAVERLQDSIYARVRQELEAISEKLAGAGGARVRTELRDGRAADEILAAAAEADLIAIGAHGRGPIGRLLVGSIAEEVARRSPIPTLVVRERAAGSPSIERVLAAVDHDPGSRVALGVAADLAERAGARLEAVHVIELPVVPVYAPSLAFPIAPIPPVPSLHELRCSIAAEVASTLGREATVHVVAGAPAPAIARLARPGDVIVCGTHGRGLLGRIAFGSVATKLVRWAPCPVLVVRPSEAGAQAPAVAASPPASG